MYLRTWKPRLSALDDGRYALKIKAKLECDDCSGRFTVEKEGSLISLEGHELRETIGQEVGKITKQRKCPKCRTPSCLAKATAVGFRRKLEDVITVGWIHYQLEK